MSNSTYSFGNVFERVIRLHSSAKELQQTLRDMLWRCDGERDYEDNIYNARRSIALLNNIAFELERSARKNDWDETARLLGRIADKAQAIASDWELADWPAAWRRTSGRGVSKYAKQVRAITTGAEAIRFGAYNTSLILKACLSRLEAQKEPEK